MKQKKQNEAKQTHKRRNVEFMDSSWKLKFLETQGTLAFYVTALLEYVHLMFLGIFYDVIVLNALHWL